MNNAIDGIYTKEEALLVVAQLFWRAAFLCFFPPVDVISAPKLNTVGELGRQKLTWTGPTSSRTFEVREQQRRDNNAQTDRCITSALLMPNMGRRKRNPKPNWHQDLNARVTFFHARCQLRCESGNVTNHRFFRQK